VAKLRHLGFFGLFLLSNFFATTTPASAHPKSSGCGNITVSDSKYTYIVCAEGQQPQRTQSRSQFHRHNNTYGRNGYNQGYYESNDNYREYHEEEYRYPTGYDLYKACRAKHGKNGGNFTSTVTIDVHKLHC
jgi:hypothetical protein